MLVDNPILKEDMEYVASQISSLGFKNSTFFITGATGLVGSLLSMSILYANDKYALGNKVIVHVRDKSKAESIFHSSSSLDYSVGDIRSEIDYDGSVDYIIHAASETKSKNMVSSPVETLLTTIEGTKNTLDFALRNKVKAFVYISSMEAFGDVDKQGRAKEEDLGYIDLTKARSSYPEGKRAAENMCCCYAHEYDVPVTVARLAQTFGAGVGKGDTRVFAQFARSVLENKDIVLLKTGVGKVNAAVGADTVIREFGADKIIFTGVAGAISFLSGLSLKQIGYAIETTLGTMSGVICDGAKSSCATKIASGISAAFDAYYAASKDRKFEFGEGIVGKDVEKTIKHVGILGQEGMKITDEVILDIMIKNI